MRLFSRWHKGRQFEYDDLPPVPITIAKLGSTAPTLDTFVDNVQAYRFGVNDFVIGSTEVIHTYKEGSDITAHVHWATNGVDVDDREVNFQLSYVIANGNEAFGGSETVISSGDVTIAASTADRTHKISSLGSAITGSIKIGAYIQWQFKRIADLAGTDPTSDPFVLAVGFHIEQDSLGSRQLFIK